MYCVSFLVECGVVFGCFFFFFKQKTAYEIRNCDWSSDVCSSDLGIFHSHFVFFTHVWYFSIAFGIFHSHLDFFTRVGYFSLAFGTFHSHLVFFNRVWYFSLAFGICESHQRFTRSEEGRVGKECRSRWSP